MKRTPSSQVDGKRVGLQVKVVGVLLVLSLTPLLASALLIKPIAEAAQNFASNEVEPLRRPLRDVHAVYQQLVLSKKRMYHHMADQLAAGAATRDAAAGGSVGPFEDLAGQLLEAEPDLLRVRLRRAGGPVVGERARNAPGRGGPTAYREFNVTSAVGGGAVVELGFAADEALLKQLEDMGPLLRVIQRAYQFRGALPRSYQIGFLVLVGGVVVLVTAAGILLSRRLTRRIALLLSGTRRVASGDLDARVELFGRDELGELAGAFNRMVEDLKSDRQQILYLQRIGAWQDVARRLAHEIKNPLTPIQLAVQQLVSSYKGDDERHKKLLADVEEIVGEEIRGLRRLVDAFSALGRLPPVEPVPLDLAVVADDLRNDPQFTGPLVVSPPAEPITVAADRLLLRRLLANLLENGIHAGQGAGRTGRVVLSWEASAAEGIARVTVDDEGGGVRPADRERIFEPYVSGKESGTGLGLAIAKKIALDHQGDLVIGREPAPTGGARFVLTLPLA